MKYSRTGMAINSDCPDKFDMERLEVLGHMAKNNTLDAKSREEFAKHFIQYAVNVSKRYNRARIYNDQIESCALFGIVYAINNMQSRLLHRITEDPDLNIAEHVIKIVCGCVRDFILRFLKRDHLVRVPAESKRLMGKKWTALNEMVECGYDVQDLEKSIKVRMHPNNNLRDIKELLEQCVVTEDDSRIIELRSHGYNDREIAERIGKGPDYVQRRRQTLAARYEELEWS